MSPIIQDPWEEEKARLENFWKTVFDYKIDWNKFKLPEKTDKLPHLNIRPSELLLDHIYFSITACKSFTFAKRKKFYMMDDYMNNARAIQSRYSNNYAWADTGQLCPDENHLGKSYVESVGEGFLFMNAAEYMLSNAETEFRTGKTYDENMGTVLSVHGHVGKVLVAQKTADWIVFSEMSITEKMKVMGPREIKLPD